MAITIFPTSFQYSFLHCFQENGKNVSVLFTPSHKKAQYIHLELDNDVFENQYIVWCEILQAKNKTKQLLSIIECLFPQNTSISKFYSSSNTNLVNEMQLIIPPRFTADRIEFVMSTIVPNFCGDVCGVYVDSIVDQKKRFDRYMKEHNNFESYETPQQMFVRKTSLPEIYEVLSTPTTCKKGILFIRTLLEAKKMTEMFNTNNNNNNNNSLISLPCYYDKVRKHWIPVFN